MRNLCVHIIFTLLLFTQYSFAQDSKPKKAPYILFEDLPIEDPASNSILLPGEKPAEKIRQNIFIKPVINKKRCFAGEPLLITYELYSALQSSSEVLTRPRLTGFHASSMETLNEDPEYREINGRRFRVFTLLKFQASAHQAGKLVIDPVTVQNEVNYENAEGKDKTYGGPVSSEPLEIIALPLPERNAPATFSGAIGKFTITASVRDSNIQANQSNSLYIEIKGAGNFTTIALPHIDWPTDFAVFSPAESDSVNNNVFPATGSKKFEIPFTVKTAGSYQLPVITFSFFDASKSTYQTASTQPLALQVMPAPVDPKPAPVQTVAAPAISKWMYWIAAAVALCAAAFILIIYKKRKQ